MMKPTKWHVRPEKAQINLDIRPVWSESLLSAWRKLGSSVTHWAHSEDSDQTGRMPKLIWFFAGHTVSLSVLSWYGFLRLWFSCYSFFIRLCDILQHVKCCLSLSDCPVCFLFCFHVSYLLVLMLALRLPYFKGWPFALCFFLCVLCWSLWQPNICC